ncbi:glycosyltransferase family 2 protein [Rhodopirellula sp. JC639]|uniref:glycosyltransferase family 2 protein n=1 Tax=Stieleria mannarensis TaxID=2755585 RepID=UPI0016041F91|nr:glycosyltransferase family 2 protein [Rhodopirellula sp. JC639]
MSNSSQRLPVFRIVTPSFNQAEYLEQTITSVLSQQGRGTEFELQYAVVDGGSTDGSADIIAKYRNELTFWCSEKDRGQSHAINKGFEQIDGDICAYINSDDYYLPDAFRHIVSLRNENPHADLLYGVCRKVDATGRTIRDQISDISSLAEIVDLWNHWLNPNPNRNFIQPEVFWTRRLSERIGRFDESLHYTMDFDYWLRGFDTGMKVARTDVPLAAFRIHAGQKTTARNASILELLDRVAPYITTQDARMDPDHQRQMQRHSRLTRRVIASADAAPERRVLSLLALAGDEPGLLNSRHYWRQMRRSGKRVFWKRHAA